MVLVLQEEPAPTKPTLIFDGECGFCRRWIRRWELTTGDSVEYVPFQEAGPRFTELPAESLSKAVHLVEPDGNVTSGAQAVFRCLALGGGPRWPLRLYHVVPGVPWASEAAYRFVANHRRFLSGATRWLCGPDTGPTSYILTRWVFIRLLAMVYLIAFASLGVQILGLIGSDGVLPIDEFLEGLRSRFGTDAYWRVPTLAWLNHSDAFLQLMCWGGVGVSLLVILRVAPGPLLLLLWALYFSLYNAGQQFLTFQWDILLLEVGILGVLWASWKPWPRLRTDSAPSRLIRWLVILLLFRLMFSSGIVKLLDDSVSQPTWHDLTALTYHYETTCIPNPVSWYAHQLPLWFHKVSVVAMFVIEIGIPFLFFLPRRLRLLAFFLQILLQFLIILTGNYNFFNLLALMLCLPLVDDAFLRRFLPRGMVSAALPRPDRCRTPWFKRVFLWPAAALILVLNVVWMSYTLRSDRTQRRVRYDYFPAPIREVISHSMSFHIVNSYGLFRSMTTRRPEIIVEGSHDGTLWKTYEFKWKPGDLTRRPAQVAPHQPRLDWQMWFAALGNYRSPRNRWFLNFQRRLLEGSPQVLALIETNPFPDNPPRYIRATLYDYRFTDWETRAADDTWWRRERLRPYTPTLSLDSFRRR